MRILKYFQLRRDLIHFVLNFLSGDYGSLLFLFLKGSQLALRFEKRYEQKVTKIKCKQKDAVISNWDAPRLLQRRVPNLKRFLRKAEVVKRNITSGSLLGQSSKSLRAL